MYKKIDFIVKTKADQTFWKTVLIFLILVGCFEFIVLILITN